MGGQLENAKQIIAKKTEEASQLEAVSTPGPKQKKTKLPLARDINTVENILNTKIAEKKRKIKDEVIEKAKTKHKGVLEALVGVAMALRRDVEKLSKTIQKESNGNIKVDLEDGYSWWGRLPKTIKEGTDDRTFFELTDSDVPAIDTLKSEIDEHVMNMKLGLVPLSDVKILLDKINAL